MNYETKHARNVLKNFRDEMLTEFSERKVRYLANALVKTLSGGRALCRETHGNIDQNATNE